MVPDHPRTPKDLLRDRILLICGYLCLLLCVGRLGYVGHTRNSAVDYFLASRTCGAFLLVMTIFGTTMTSFALVGSTGEAYRGSASTGRWPPGRA